MRSTIGAPLSTMIDHNPFARGETNNMAKNITLRSGALQTKNAQKPRKASPTALKGVRIQWCDPNLEKKPMTSDFFHISPEFWDEYEEALG